MGDFKERRELALELMKAGADINMQNRFGCTPAHENILIQNYENLNFLVEHGADPSIEDNDGISMRSLVGFFPEALMIFSKAGFLEAKEKLNKQNRNGKLSNVIIVESLMLKNDVQSVVQHFIVDLSAKKKFGNLIGKAATRTIKVKLKLK